MQQEFIIVVSCKKNFFIYLAFIFSFIYTSILYFSNNFTSVKVGKYESWSWMFPPLHCACFFSPPDLVIQKFMFSEWFTLIVILWWTYIGMPDEQREGLQEELIDIILRVLKRNPQLHYYQGYHDIVVTFLLVVKERLATALVEKLSTHHLRYFHTICLITFTVY